jgi:hypothetical protein
MYITEITCGLLLDGGRRVVRDDGKGRIVLHIVVVFHTMDTIETIVLKLKKV